MKTNLYIADIKSTNVHGKSEGHYFAVANNYYDIFQDDYCVKIAGGPVYSSSFAGQQLFVMPYDSCTKNKLVDWFRCCVNGVSLLKISDKNSIIIFQCSAVSITLLLLALIKPKGKVFLVQYDQMIVQSKVKSLLYRFAKNRIEGIICPGKEIGESLRNSFCVVPDYIYVEKKRVNRIDYNKRKIDFGFYGVLAEGKGIYEAAEFFAKTGYQVSVAGKVSELAEDINMYKKLRALAEKYNNVSLDIGYLEDSTYQFYLTNTKYIVLNYSGSYALRSSGVILDALYSATPVIVKNRAYVQFVRDNEVGYVYDNLKELKIDELLNAENYAEKQAQIKKYLKTQDSERIKLMKFIGG